MGCFHHSTFPWFWIVSKLTSYIFKSSFIVQLTIEVILEKRPDWICGKGSQRQKSKTPRVFIVLSPESAKVLSHALFKIERFTSTYTKEQSN